MLINIGWARAASTALRANFLKRHPQILAVDCSQRYEDGPAAAVLQHLKRGDTRKFEDYLPQLSRAWERYARSRRGRVICLADETLSIGLPSTGVVPKTIAARCGQLFPRARVLAIVRDQVGAIRSLHALALRNKPNLMPLGQWVDRHFLKPAEGEDFTYLFSYMETLQVHLDHRPRSDVFVLPHNRLQNDAGLAYRDISHWLRVSARSCRGLPNEIVNASAQPTAGDCYGPGQENAIRDLYAADRAWLLREFAVAFPSDCDVF